MKKILMFMFALSVSMVASSSFSYAQISKRQQAVSNNTSKKIVVNSHQNPHQNSYKNSYRHTTAKERSVRAITPRTDRIKVVKRPTTTVIMRPPSGHVVHNYKGVKYYRSGSKYYTHVNSRYMLTPPPIGIRIPVLPALHTIFTFNNLRYYCSEGIIYRQIGREYEVMAPEYGMLVPELPAVNVREVYIDGTIFYEFEGILYKQVPTKYGVQYRVMGSLEV